MISTMTTSAITTNIQKDEESGTQPMYYGNEGGGGGGDMDMSSRYDSHSTCYFTTASTENGSDVIQEIRNKSKKENRNVNRWRIALVLVLTSVGIAVTLTTYNFLKQNELNSFETAFEKFSRTVADAAINQQKDIKKALAGLSNEITVYVQSTNNVSWPFVTVPLIETYAEHFFAQSGNEIFAILPLVKNEERQKWENYTDENYQDMIQEAHMIRYGNLNRLKPEGFKPFIAQFDFRSRGFVPDEDRDVYFPAWHFSPPPFTYGFVNWNLHAVSQAAMEIFKTLLELKNETLFTDVRPFARTGGVAFTPEEHAAFHSKITNSSVEHPHTYLYHPIHEVINDYNSPIVAVITSVMAWDYSMLNLLPEGVAGLRVIIKNTCEQNYTYEINGPQAIFIGEGDIHDPVYEKYSNVIDLSLHTHPNYSSSPGHCQYTMHIYPTQIFVDNYHTFVPVAYAIVVASTFVLVAIVFLIYNSFVNQRNEILVYNAARSNAVISALFPKSIRDRIMEDEQEAINKKISPRSLKAVLSGRSALKNVTTGGDANVKRPPLADYFPETTILFADVSGFTAWSSVREPSQVFTLLETLYGAFDNIAKSSRVFKVETVGDCYVAATGIPEFHKEHAVHMVRFAKRILNEMVVLTQAMEITLGPDTGDLSLRIGIHSGPVTAGVLRGERARFQLFGDTMNTASRIESTGEEGRIHISQETAESLKVCGKGEWLVKRTEPVKIKGKGDIQTYWVGMPKDDHKMDASIRVVDKSERNSSEKAEGSFSNDGLSASFRTQELSLKNDADIMAAREARLVDWNVHMLKDFLKQIVARRLAAHGLSQTRSHTHESSSHHNGTSFIMDGDYAPLDEVREIIRLPEFDSKVAKLQKNHQLIHLPPQVEHQLHEYVTCIAQMYRENDFHNFEHASHVTMSVIKLLSRIVAPTDLDENLGFSPEGNLRAQLHDHTYGITSDPLTQFACAFSALIHDVDHVGVPNAQLVKEKTDIATRYKDRSVAEQNSMVLAWNLLMEDRFNELRLCLCETPMELRRFRNLVINGVMATDITDKELKNLRNARWEKAFKDPSMIDGEDHTPEEDVRDVIHRKATIVIEHLIQASDVAHTMQHWHVYRKWNERFFRECYAAYKAGRAENDPSEGWYKGEIGFFDFYIIPLAKKLDTCGVFGKSSDEYLNYALQNREEWKKRGEEVVAEMLEAVRQEQASVDTFASTETSPMTVDDISNVV